jgi:alginate O-acetyltransferase complex protein AlgI
MLFNTYGFIFLFLPIVWSIYYHAARTSIRVSAIWLCLASLFFYAWWNPKFLALLLISIAFNFLIGRYIGLMPGHAKRYRVLVFGVVVNLLLLGVFKYFNFFVENLNWLLSTQWTVNHIILPLGISFFTFTQIAFLVDSQRGETTDFDFVRYVLFVTYFPHLIAGPVLHHKQVMPQFENPQTYALSYRNLSLGLTIFALGLFKKVMLADDFAIRVEPVFTQAELGGEPKFLAAWTAVLSYTLQLYFDFSGYSDMAIGISHIFGVKLPLNFDAPYKAKNISVFWQRWHMTLSQFLRDYLYIPLGGNRNGTFARYRNLMLTMVLGGLWHGASWTFVIWGALHGLYLVIHHAFRNATRRIIWPTFTKMFCFAPVLLTFLSVAIAWIFFRAQSTTAAWAILRGCVGLNGLAVSGANGGAGAGIFQNSVASLFTALGGSVVYTGVFETVMAGLNPNAAARLLLIGMLVVWCAPTSSAVANRLLRNYAPWRMAFNGLFVSFVFLISLSHIGRISTFIYYQF